MWYYTVMLYSSIFLSHSDYYDFLNVYDFGFMPAFVITILGLFFVLVIYTSSSLTKLSSASRVAACRRVRLPGRQIAYILF